MDKKILIVDDAVFVRKMTEEALRNAGYESIFEAATAQEAKKLFLEQDPDLVVLDVTLPDCEDLCLCQELFRLKKDANVIIYSAVTQELVKEQAKKIGVAGYFTKPMDVEEFIKLVNSILKAPKGT
ncbi:MAG: response regulator [Lachnospiraceae bacterium]|nr:response regulator [Lachnospiraceae bacterium]